MKGLKQKKAHLMEIQVNGGTIADKVDYGYKFFEKRCRWMPSSRRMK